MQRQAGPLIDEGLEILSEDDCLALMATVPVGRVAVSVGALPAVFPVNFALYDRRIVFRTGKGTKLDASVRNAVVAFEVDHFDAMYHEGWSVLAVGMAEDITDNLELIGGDGRVRPWAGGDRSHYVSIEIELLSGRRINRSDLGSEDISLTKLRP
jgi:hypothetical protein